MSHVIVHEKCDIFWEGVVDSGMVANILFKNIWKGVDFGRQQ